MDDLKQRLRAATEGVTPGPWEIGGDTYKDAWYTEWREVGPFTLATCYDGPDANFIAAARTLIPEAAAALDALEAENARYRAALERIAKMDQNVQYMQRDTSSPPLFRACVIARAALTHQ